MHCLANQRANFTLLFIFNRLSPFPRTALSAHSRPWHGAIRPIPSSLLEPLPSRVGYKKVETWKCWTTAKSNFSAKIAFFKLNYVQTISEYEASLEYCLSLSSLLRLLIFSLNRQIKAKTTVRAVFKFKMNESVYTVGYSRLCSSLILHDYQCIMVQPPTVYNRSFDYQLVKLHRHQPYFQNIIITWPVRASDGIFLYHLIKIWNNSRNPSFVCFS